MWTRKELKSNAKALLKRNYWMSVAVVVVLTMVTSVISMVVAFATYPVVFNSVLTETTNISQESTSSTDAVLNIYGAAFKSLLSPSMIVTWVIILICVFLISILVINPLSVGVCRWVLNNRKGEADFADIIFGFKNNYFENVLTMFMLNLFVFLWSLLFVIPGIVKAYQYRMVPYIIAENPGITWKEALAKSKEMMQGQKWNSFVLDLSFIGWYLLVSLCCAGSFIMIFFLLPYVLLTEGELYAKLKGYGSPFDEEPNKGEYADYTTVE